MSALALLLASGLALAAPAPLAPLDEQVVDYVVKTEVPDMDPKLVSRFLELDLEQVRPEKRRKAARRKRLAIDVALKLHQAQKRGLQRLIPAGGTAGCVPSHRPDSEAGSLLAAGFEEIEEDVIDCVEKRTRCTEEDLICEFTLNVTVKQGKRPLKRYFIHGKDPLMTKVAECRGKAGGQTNFFGSSGASCSR